MPLCLAVMLVDVFMSFQVGNSGFELFDIFAKVPDAPIAMLAQQSSYFSGAVVMINLPRRLLT